MLEKEDFNYIDFICERGLYYEFYKNYCGDFYPLKEQIRKIKKENKVSRVDNYKLRREIVG